MRYYAAFFKASFRQQRQLYGISGDGAPLSPRGVDARSSQRFKAVEQREPP
jgi:hypothetical protein